MIGIYLDTSEEYIIVYFNSTTNKNSHFENMLMETSFNWNVVKANIRV